MAKKSKRMPPGKPTSTAEVLADLRKAQAVLDDLVETVAAKLQDQDGGSRPRQARAGRGKKRTPADEERNRWVYEQCCLGRVVTYKQIVAELKRQAPARGWKSVTSEERVRQIAGQYALEHGLPPPRRRQNL